MSTPPIRFSWGKGHFTRVGAGGEVAVGVVAARTVDHGTEFLVVEQLVEHHGVVVADRNRRKVHFHLMLDRLIVSASRLYFVLIGCSAVSCQHVYSNA